VKQGGGSILLRDAFQWQVVTGKLVRIEGTINGARLRQHFDENLLQSANDLQLKQIFVFQQDNNPKHTAKAIV
jgi:hypothetical protein